MKKIMEIARYTTPLIRVNFKEVDVSDITEAVLTIKQGATSLQNDSFSIGYDTEGNEANCIEFSLSQTQTASLSEGLATMMCDYFLADNDFRGRSKIVQVKITSSGVEGVMEDE